MRHVLHELPYPSKDTSIVHAPDRRVVQPAAALFASEGEMEPSDG